MYGRATLPAIVTLLLAGLVVLISLHFLLPSWLDGPAMAVSNQSDTLLSGSFSSPAVTSMSSYAFVNQPWD